MGAALALAIMLVVLVAVLSLAVNAQGPLPVPKAPSATSRSSHPGSSGSTTPRPPRKPVRDRGERTERSRDRHPDAEPSGSAVAPASPVDDGPALADVRPLNSQAQALVMSVVDERTLGPVTRSRLTLRIEPTQGDAFEVSARVAFPTPEDRARVKVGAMISVRYDSEDHRRVVVDPDGEGRE